MSVEIPSLSRLTSIFLANKISSWEAFEHGWRFVDVDAIRSIECEREVEERMEAASRVTDMANRRVTPFSGHGYSSFPPEGSECPYCQYRRELLDMYRKGLFTVWACKNCVYPRSGNYELDYMSDASQRGFRVTAPDAACPSPSGRCQGSNHQASRSRHVWEPPKGDGWDGANFTSLPPPCWIPSLLPSSNYVGSPPSSCCFVELPERLRNILFYLYDD